MRTESVEIYSDASNQAVVRHPGRRFPGSLIQGDTLYSVCPLAEHVYAASQHRLDDDTRDDLAKVCHALRGRLEHYKAVLKEHDIELPFVERP